jgi:hypothetical protein
LTYFFKGLFCSDYRGRFINTYFRTVHWRLDQNIGIKPLVRSWFYSFFGFKLWAVKIFLRFNWH